MERLCPDYFPGVDIFGLLKKYKKNTTQNLYVQNQQLL